MAMNRHEVTWARSPKLTLRFWRELHVARGGPVWSGSCSTLGRLACVD